MLKGSHLPSIKWFLQNNSSSFVLCDLLLNTLFFNVLSICFANKHIQVEKKDTNKVQMNIHSHLSSTVHKKFTKTQRCNTETFFLGNFLRKFLCIEHKYNVDIRLRESDPVTLTQEKLFLWSMIFLNKIWGVTYVITILKR